MNEIHRFGNLGKIDFEVVERSGQLYLRYDAGAHQIAWREDEISEKEFEGIVESAARRNETMFAIQKRLESAGVNPYFSNWKPK